MDAIEKLDAKYDEAKYDTRYKSVGWRHSLGAGGSLKDFHDRPSLIYIVSFPNLILSRLKPAQVIFFIWFCDFAS